MVHKKEKSSSYKPSITCFCQQVIKLFFHHSYSSSSLSSYFWVYWVFIFASQTTLWVSTSKYLKETTFQHNPLLSGCILVSSFYHSHSSSLSTSWIKILLSVLSAYCNKLLKLVLSFYKLRSETTTFVKEDCSSQYVTIDWVFP
jgi:hypothetical protein